MEVSLCVRVIKYVPAAAGLGVTLGWQSKQLLPPICADQKGEGVASPLGSFCLACSAICN